jgi:hypothetical protein
MNTASGRVTTITDVNPGLRTFALGDLKPVKWRSFDGMEIWGLLLTPSDAPAGRPLPTLAYIHGGPGGGFTYGLFPQFMHIVPQVDHLVADVDRHSIRGFVQLQSEAPIEREHCIGVLHGHRDMVETPNASCRLCRSTVDSSDSSRT